MWLDLSIVLLFVLYSVAVGFRHRRQASRNLEEYFLAGRSLKGWRAGISMAATQYAADTPLLVAGLVATAGLFSLWRLWVYGIAFLLMGFVLSALWRRARVLTDAEFTELRYGGRLARALRVLKALHLGTFVNCTVLAMVLLAATRIAELFLPWHQWLPAAVMEPLAGLLETLRFPLASRPPDDPALWLVSADNFLSISLIVAFTWLYSTTGGLRSVVATDVVQFTLMLFGTAAYAWIVVQQVGGLPDLSDALGRLYGAEAARGLLSFGPIGWDEGVWLFCAVLGVQWFAQVNADGTGYLAQRSMACRTDRGAAMAAVTFAFAQVLVRSLLWLPIILGLLVLYPAAPLPPLGTAPEAFRVERELTFALGMRELLPIGVRGLMVTAMLAALASTVDTHLNWGASYWTNDLYRPLMGRLRRRPPGERELVWAARASSLGILFLALLIAMRLASIQSAWHLSLLVGGGLGVVLILRWLWHRINVYSELTAGAVSLLLSPLLLFGAPDLSEGARLLWMVGLSTAAVLAVTWATRPEPAAVLETFYRRVRPCGFWAPVAARLGEDPTRPLRTFRRAAGATLLASASVFSLLIGAGWWLVRLPGAPAWSPLWLVGLGLALIPVWIRLGVLRPDLDAPAG